ADLTKQPGCGKLSGMLGRERVSGRAELSESNDGCHDGGHLMEPAEPFGSFVVGRPFPGCGRSGLLGGHRGQGPGIASARNETCALEWDGESGSAGPCQLFRTNARMMFHVFDHWDRGCF